MTNINQPPPLPKSTGRESTGTIVGLTLISVLGIVGLFAGVGGGGSHPDVKVKAQDAAVIGDTVTVRYPASTIMCSEQYDASKVYMAGELAMRQSMRIDQSPFKSVGAKSDARKAAMTSAYSCQWAPHGMRYTVANKAIVGTENDAYHIVRYCLQPAGRDTCWWITETYDWTAEIEKVAGN